MIELNVKCLASWETVQGFDFVGDSAYLVAACTWEMTERHVPIIKTPAAVAEIILTAMKKNSMTYSIVAKFYVDEK